MRNVACHRELRLLPRETIFIRGQTVNHEAKLREYGVDFIHGNLAQEPGMELEHDFGEGLA